jgi:hypothetical protein
VSAFGGIDGELGDDAMSWYRPGRVAKWLFCDTAMGSVESGSIW